MRWIVGLRRRRKREAAGKSRKGKIIFSAESTAGELRLSLSDDGTGLDEVENKGRGPGKEGFYQAGGGI